LHIITTRTEPEACGVLAKLLHMKADPDARDYEGTTALMTACALDLRAHVQLLLAHGAHVFPQNHVWLIVRE